MDWAAFGTTTTVFWLSWQLVIINEINLLISKGMWRETQDCSFLFLGVAAPSALFMCLSNFYARSLIRFHLYGRSLRSAPFSSQLRIKRRCTLTYDSSRWGNPVKQRATWNYRNFSTESFEDEEHSTRYGASAFSTLPWQSKVKG